MKKNVVQFPDRNRIEEEAGEWIVRFEGDEPPTQQDIDELKAWMARSPTHREVLTRYASLWNDMDLLSELVLPLDKVQQPKKSLLTIPLGWLLAPVMCLAALMRMLFGTPSGRWVAVSILALSLLAVFSLSLPEGHDTNNTYITALGERTTQTLEDGSTLWLNTNSEVEVDYSDEKRRIVLHRGEVFFEVAREPSRPFEVYAGTRMVRAVGTAFSVYRENHSIKVTVTEGRVDLAVVKPRTESAAPEVGHSSTASQAPTAARELPQEEIGELLGPLVAGQSIELAGDDSGTLGKVINHERQELARRLSWRDGLLVFAGEPLDKVVEEVGRYTALNITIADPELKALRIGGQFQIGETEALFDALESGFGLQVSSLGNNHVEIRPGKQN